jgi:hypothetical protein
MRGDGGTLRTEDLMRYVLMLERRVSALEERD